MGCRPAKAAHINPRMPPSRDDYIKAAPLMPAPRDF
jgi:hypothetical protein